MTIDSLEALRPKHSFFVGIDSDGCVFDSMEIKHKECFIPQFIHHFDLQAVSKYAREAWEFVNLYSKTRGVNRFLAVLHVLDLLADRAEVRARAVTPPRLEGLREWTRRETKLGNAALKRAAERGGAPDLERTLEWSEDVNATVARIVRGVPPFPHVRASLEKIGAQADAIVCSQTPTEALEREWQEHDIGSFVRFIAGQEIGTKGEHLRAAAKGKYAPAHGLMIGDAPGDLKAARANDFLFFPIVAGEEEVSWAELSERGLPRFFDGTYAGAYEAELLERFERSLPETPPWSRR